MELISVVVLTYNSEKTIIETLESIKNQTYKKIELIIADDCSQDKTIEKIKQWVDKKKNRFEQIVFLTSNQNYGITKNINKAWKNATGTWIKTIAGDDLLLPKCIEKNLEFSKKDNKMKAIFSKMELFEEQSGKKYKMYITPLKDQEKFYEKNSEEQHNELLVNSFNMAPSSFLKKSLLEEVGYANEEFKMVEDLPLWIKITEKGEKLHLNPEVLVMYRIGNGISNRPEKLINLNFNSTMEEIYQKLIYPKLVGKNKIYKYNIKFDFYLQKKIAKIFGNKKTKLSIAVLKATELTKINFYKRKVRAILYKK